MPGRFILSLFLFVTGIVLQAQPLRNWGSYYGDVYSDYGYATAVDASGNIYVTGKTSGGVGFTTIGSHQMIHGGGWDAFIVKFDASGQRLWCTYYGGSGNDEGRSVAVDPNGFVYVCGITISPNAISTAGSHQPALAGNLDAFIVKFDSMGVRQWATYYGGPGDEYGGLDLAIDNASMNIIMSGSTYSASGISTVGSHQPSLAGGRDAFLVQFNPAGTVQWATYYGGSTGNGDDGYSVEVDNSGAIFLCGETGSATGISTAGSHQPVYSNSTDAFLVKFNGAGVRQWATYYGGPGADYGYAVAVDGTGNAFLTGNTGSSSGISTAGAHQSTFGGGASGDGFVVKFNGNGVRQWGTYYGGSGSDWGWSVQTDVTGNVYIAGETGSASGISTPGSFQPNNGGGFLDAYVTKINGSGLRQWGTYYGGSYSDRGLGLALAQSGATILCGHTNGSPGLGSATGFQTTFGGGAEDVFVVQFNTCSSPPLQPGAIAGSTLVCEGISNTFSISPVAGAIAYTWILPAGWSGSSTGTSISVVAGGTSGNIVVVANHSCGYSEPESLFVNVSAIQLSINSTTPLCYNDSTGTLSATAAGNGPFSYAWSNNQSAQSINNLTAGTYSVLVTDVNGCEDSASIGLTQPPVLDLNSSASNVYCHSQCNGSVYLFATGGTPSYSYSGPTFGLCAGSYTFTVTDVNGCTASSSAIVSEPPQLIQSVYSTSPVLCDSGCVTLNSVPGGGTPPYYYQWSPGNSTSFLLTACPNTTTTYSCVVSDQNGCTETAMMTITVGAAPVVVAAATDSAVCSGQPTTLIANGASTYSWQPGNLSGFFVNVSPSSSTTYTVTGIDQNGCMDSGTVSITINPSPSVDLTFTSALDTLCTSSSGVVLAGGTPSGGTYSGPTVSGGMFFPSLLPSGSYPVVYTFADAEGCEAADTAMMVVDICLDVDQAGERIVAIYPNPSSGIITLHLPPSTTGQLEIYDAVGQLIYSETITKEMTVIDLGDQPNGIYFVNLISEGEAFTQKIVIQK